MSIGIVFPLAVALALILMPLATRLAWVAGFLDHPQARKLHTSATALLGGAAIFVAALGAVLISRIATTERWEVDAVALLGGGLVALLVGLWDDRFGMQPMVKMFGQGVAIALLLASGAIPDLHLGTVGNVAAAVFVLIALMNAVNFLDNMNGVVSGLSAIALAGFAWGSATRGAFGVAAVQLALAGGCFGFLPYNFPRARIFLGDAGSLFLGYSLGASAVLAFEGGPQGWGQIGPVIALAYPAFDMIFVVATRLHDGRKVSQGGTDHSTHRLARVLRCQTRTVLLLWLGGAVLSVSGFVVQSLNRPIPTLLLSGLWLGLFLWAGMRLSSVPIEPMPPLPTRS
jgi:UDP-GlcNAc:undecaprenyl-phosphate GlcNAc-1-phosphate transferase